MPSFTGRELDLMSILWELGSATGRQIHERLDDEIDYTTVLTVLRTMEQKGYVRHDEEGRAYRYHPVVDRDVAGQTAFRRLVQKFFGGSPERFLAHLTSGEEELDPAERERLEGLVRRHLEKSER